MLYQITNSCQNPVDLSNFTVSARQEKKAAELWKSCSTGNFQRKALPPGETFTRPSTARLIPVVASGKTVWWLEAEPGTAIELRHKNFPSVVSSFEL